LTSHERAWIFRIFLLTRNALRDGPLKSTEPDDLRHLVPASNQGLCCETVAAMCPQMIGYMSATYQVLPFSVHSSA